MMRAVFGGMAAVVVGLSSLGGASVAQAEPYPPCSYTLSPPQLVQVDGASVVTATVTPACVFPGSPYVSVVCLQLQGEGGAQCTQNPETAQIFFAPYRPGATYLASGRGCGSWVGNSITHDCQILGPLSATL